MVYKTCSVQKVLAQIYRDFKPSHSGWAEDAIEWIADAIEIMKCNQSYAEQSVELKVVDYRAKLPCEVESVLGIVYENSRLTRNGGLNHKFPDKNSCLSSMLPNVTNSYSLNPNYIHTSFAEGCILVYYQGYELDCDGYPFVIDDAVYRDALKWYVLMIMLGRGFKHQVFGYKDALQMWNTTYPRAQNRCKMPDIDGMENFKKNWLGIAKSVNRTNDFFDTTEIIRNNDAHNPGDLLQTFQIIGPNLNNP